MRQQVFGGMGETLGEQIEKSLLCYQVFEPKGGVYFGAFSGGKDSITIKRLAEMAGVKIKWYYSVTTVDPPELIKFIKQYHPDVVFLRPKRPLWAMVESKGLPTRLSRWCCEKYKECYGKGQRTVIGVRWAESSARAKRWKQFSTHQGKERIAPILSWSDDDVWQFIKEQKLPYCELYDEGYSRLGCVMCPLGSTVEKEAKRWPRIARQWRKGADLFWERRTAVGADSMMRFPTKDSFWDWWITGEYEKGNTAECDGLGLFT